MLRLSRYPPNNTGVTGRGTLEAPATTTTNIAETVGHASVVCWHIQPQEPSVRIQQKHTTTKLPSKPTHAVVAALSDNDENSTTTNWQYTRHL